MLVKVLVAVAALLVIFVIVVAMQPGTFRVVRSATIGAPAAVVFAQVNDLRRWEAWSPWAKLDPGMKQTYEGPPEGAGAVSAWSGNSKVGEGRMTITESRANELVRLRLDFLRPFKSSSVAELEFKPDGDGTVVTWSMSGDKNFLSKAFCLFADMDKMIGGDFEKGLARLKAVAESSATPQPEAVR
jgi:uncharacterized protein YndB with AHSA1/START domain